MFSSPAPRGPYLSSPSVSDTPQSLRDQYRESESRRAEAVATNHCLQAAVSDLQSEVTVLRQQLLFNQQQQQQPGDTTFFSSSPNRSHHPQRGFGNVPSIAERLGGRTPPREEGEAPSSWSPSRGALGGVAAAPMSSSSSSPRRPVPAEVPMGLMQIRAVPMNTDPLRGVRAGTTATTTEDWDRRDEIAQRARSCAEDIMRRFVYSLTESKKAKDTLAEVQLEAVRLRSLLDEADSREALLTQMMASYSDALGQQMRVGQEQEQRARSMEALGSGVVATSSSSSLAITASTGPSSSSSNPATEKALRAALLGDDLSAEEVRSLLQTCTENVAQLDQVRREMLQMRLDEALEENASLKLRLQQQQQQQQGGSASQGRSGGSARYPVVGSSSFSSPLSPHSTNAHSGFHDSDSLLLPKQKKEQPPLLSNERAMLVALMERDQLMQQRLVTMKEMVLEREKRIEQMKVLLAAKK